VNKNDNKHRLTFWWLELAVLGAILAVLLVLAH